MKFYSKITKKPESVIEQIKDGLKVVKQTRVCVFKEGVCETNDPKVIEKLQAHPEYFRTDHPWKELKPIGNKVKLKVLKKKKEIVKALNDKQIK